MRVSREVYEQHVKNYGPGQTIFEEGDAGTEMYVIVEGKIEIRKSTSGSSSKILVVLEKGDIFGEMAIIEKKKRSASATTKEAARLLVLNEDLFESTLEKNPDFASKIIRILSERLRRMNAVLQNVLSTNRQNQVLTGLVEYTKEFGTSTFKGPRIHMGQFLDWARQNLGLHEDEMRTILQSFMKRGVLTPSARGGEEVIFKAS
jgi:CRP-like cAMP-binding protein